MAEETSETKFGEWCVVELFGHRRYAGWVTEHQIGGASFIRIDVPAADGEPDVSQFYSPSAIYCLTPVTEAMARAVAAGSRPRPIYQYELTAPQRENDQEDNDGDDLDDVPY